MASRVSTSSSSPFVLFYLCVFSYLSLSLLPAAVLSLSVANSSDVNRNFTCTSSPNMKFPVPDICPNKRNNTLHILGFVPATNDVFESDNIIPAAFAAIDEINANCSLLPNYTLELEFVNTLCDPSEATWQLIDSIILQKNTSKKIAFFGGGCSLATEPVAALSGRFYRIPQISYGASSPSLSQRNMFPRFVRTIPSEVQANMARFALMKRYKWERVATLHETQTIFSLAVNDFHERYDDIYNTTMNHDEEENLIPRSFTDDPRIPLDQIKEKEIRIIFGYFYEDKANTVVCQAISKGLFTKNHFWAFPAWFTSGWWDKDYDEGGFNCSRQQMREAVDRSFYLDSYNFGSEQVGLELDTGCKSAEEFNRKYECYLEEFRSNPKTQNITRNNSLPHNYRTFTYDAVYATAIALDATERELAMMREENSSFTLSLNDYTYFDLNIVSKMITDNMMAVNFDGITGRVRFDENGTRVGLNAIYQLLINNSNVQQGLDLLAIHDPTRNIALGSKKFNLEFNYSQDPIFKTDLPPKDQRTPNNVYMRRSLVVACYLFICISILIALFLLTFNIVTMFKPLVRDSAPHINNVIIIGCIVMLTTCFLLSIDTANPHVDAKTTATPDDELADEILERRDYRYGIICNLRLWFLTIGFTLSFGALFAKTWQVYRVYTNPKLQKEPLKMWNFLIIMAIFLAVDIAYLTFWTSVYRFKRGIVITDVDNEDVENIYEMCLCDNFPYLIGALYVYKGLLVVFGLFLAYESRNVKYHYINDSRFVSIAMYIVIILVGIGAPLSLVLAVHNFIDAAYGLTVFMIIASTLSCLFIIFIPKFVFMARGKETMVRENAKEEITVSDGLQLGHTTIDQTEMRIAEEEVSQLKQENTKKEQEINQLECAVNPNRTGSDGDSGVLVTADENDIFSTESTANGDLTRCFMATPSSYEDDHLNDCENAIVTTENEDATIEDGGMTIGDGGVITEEA